MTSRFCYLPVRLGPAFLLLGEAFQGIALACPLVFHLEHHGKRPIDAVWFAVVIGHRHKMRQLREVVIRLRMAATYSEIKGYCILIGHLRFWVRKLESCSMASAFRFQWFSFV